MTVRINHHLVVNHTEWKAIINALDYLDVCLHGDEPVQEFVVDSLKENFPSGLLCKLSEKIATSN